MKISLSLLLLLSFYFSVTAQKKPIPTGTFHTEYNGTTFELTVNKDKEFKISLATGTLVETDSLTKLELDNVDSQVFGIKYLEQKASDSLSITFSKDFKNFNLYYIYMGTSENKNDEVSYTSSEKLFDYFYGKEQDTVEIKIPKEKYLHLLENKRKKTSNLLYSFELPKNVSKIEVNYQPSTYNNIELTGEYDEEAQTITIYEGKKSPLVFHIDYKKHISSFEKPYNIAKDIEHESIDALLAKNTSDPYKTPYQFKLKTFKSLESAKSKALEENKPLILIYLPNDKNREGSFKSFVQAYEGSLSNKMYDEYKEKYDGFHFYLLTEQDKQIIEKHTLNNDAMLAISGDERLLYKQDVHIKELTVLFTMYSSQHNDISTLHLMNRLDKLTNSNVVDNQEAQEVFTAIAKADMFNFYTGYNDETTRYNNYRQNELEEKNIAFYKLNSGPKKVDAVYLSLVKSHQKDINVDYDFANLVGKFLQTSYKTKLYNESKTPIIEADLIAIDYLIKFKESLLKYEASDNEDYDKRYYFKDLFSYIITSALNKGAKEVDAEMLQNIKRRFNDLNNDDSQYLNFLQTYLPEEFLETYNDYFKENFGSNENIITQLDALYTKRKTKTYWDSYKKSIANQANSAAWMVVEKIDKPKIIKQAINWSKMSLDIDKDNPYYLDTYAQLLYKNGQKKEAIKLQLKALNIIKADLKKYGESLLEEVDNVLEQMEKGSYK